MKAIALSMAVLLAVSPVSMAQEAAGRVAELEKSMSQRKIDLPYREPSPTLALANGIVIPGGGWFYLSNSKKRIDWDFAAGFALLASTVGLALFAANGVRKNDAAQTAAGFSGLVVIRWFDLTSSTNMALKRRCQPGGENCWKD